MRGTLYIQMSPCRETEHHCWTSVGTAALCLCGPQVAQLAGIPKRITEVAHQAGMQLEESLRVRVVRCQGCSCVLGVKGWGLEASTYSFWWPLP